MTLRILHLEDDSLDAEFIKATIEHEGVACDIFRVIYRDDFVAALERGIFDVILSDYLLPDFDGLSALAIAKKRCPDIPFIFVTGAMGEEPAIETLHNGATDYVLKTNIARLVPSMQRALRETTERSERRKAEEALRESAGEIHDLYNNAPCGYHSLDKDGLFVRINDTELSWLGYARDELIRKKKFSDLMTPESMKIFNKNFPIFKDSGWARDIEYEIVRKDGTIFPVLLNSTAITDAKGNFAMSRAIMYDITRRKELEKLTAATNQLLKLFSQKVSRKEYFAEVVEMVRIWSDCKCAGIRTLNAQGFIPYASYAGFSRKFWESENLLSIHQDRCACIRAISGNFEVQDRPYVTPNGSFHCNDMMNLTAGLSEGERKRYRGTCVKHGYASVTIIPIRNDDNILGAIHIADKATNKVSQKTVELIESLSHIIGEAIYRFSLEDEKTKAQSEAIRTAHLASIGELASGVAHEINNPVSGIINYAEMLSDKFSSESRESEITDRIIKEGVRIANIVKSLLSFAKQSGEDKRPVRIKDILFESLALTKTMLKKDGIRLKLFLDSEVPPVIANFQQIQQVFLNLINNSRYALKQKYDGLSEDKQIQITFMVISKNNKAYVRTLFLDNGTGISKDMIDKIMDPFVSTKPISEGTGLGLSISHGIISDHNGTLTLESVEGDFTEVMIDLPAQPRGEKKNEE